MASLESVRIIDADEDDDAPDLPEVPLSIFVDDYNEQEFLYEWFLEEMKHCQKVGGDETNAVYCIVFALTSFGLFRIGSEPNNLYANAIYWAPYTPFQFITNYRQVDMAASGISYVYAPGATVAAVELAVASAVRAFYDGTPYAVNYNEATNFPYLIKSADFGYPATARAFFDRYFTRIKEAYNRINGKSYGMDGKTTLKFDKEGLIRSAGQEYASQAAEATAAAGDSGTWSSKNWPELPGYATQYVDNIGVFVPVGYTVDGNATNWYREVNPTDAGRIVFLLKGEPGNSLEERAAWSVTSPSIENVLSSVPVVGPVLGWSYNQFETFLKKNKAQLGLVWGRCYAFGRNKEVTPVTYKELYDIWNRMPQIWKNTYTLDAGKYNSMVALLQQKGYVPGYKDGNLIGQKPGDAAAVAAASGWEKIHYTTYGYSKEGIWVKKADKKRYERPPGPPKYNEEGW